MSRQKHPNFHCTRFEEGSIIPFLKPELNGTGLADGKRDVSWETLAGLNLIHGNAYYAPMQAELVSLSSSLHVLSLFKHVSLQWQQSSLLCSFVHCHHHHHSVLSLTIPLLFIDYHMNKSSYFFPQPKTGETKTTKNDPTLFVNNQKHRELKKDRSTFFSTTQDLIG